MLLKEGFFEKSSRRDAENTEEGRSKLRVENGELMVLFFLGVLCAFASLREKLGINLYRLINFARSFI